MYDTDILCPICQLQLTDIDGMLECQNKQNITHFVWGYGKPYFNFKVWSETIETGKYIRKRMRLNKQ